MTPEQLSDRYTGASTCQSGLFPKKGPPARSLPFYSYWKTALVFAGAATLMMVGALGCRPALAPGKPVSQLTAPEADGHAVYQQQCARCHTAYSTHALHGPSLLGVFRKPYLPSGAPANDQRVTAVVLHGRDMMQSFGRVLDEEQLTALLAYLHTL